MAQPSDLTELSALINSAYRGDSSRKGWTTEADLLDDVRTDAKQLAQEIGETGCVILCLRRHGETSILGCVLLKRIDADVSSQPETYLGMLTIQPTLQASGMGRALLHGAEDFARDEWNARSIVMRVINVRAELIAWYERRGYRLNGKTEPFPGQAAFHFSWMEKRL